MFYNILFSTSSAILIIYLCDMNNVIDNMHLLVLHIGRRYCGADWNFRNVCSPFTRIYYITAGEAEIETPEGITLLREGHMYIIPAFTPHSCRCRKEFEHYYIHLYNESGEYILEDWEIPREITAVETDLGHIARLLELCPGMELSETDPKSYDNNSSLAQRIEFNKQRDLWARIESRGLIYILLSRFMHGARPKTYVHDERIKAVLTHIRANLTTRLDLETLAEMVHLSKDHLIRLFKQEMNTTPLLYINTKRIEAAQLRLVTETRPVKEIAYSLGFDDQAYFSRLFKKHTGMTPLAYKNLRFKV